MCFISVSLDYGRVRIKFGDFNIGELLKNSPIANINFSPINHLVGYDITIHVQLIIDFMYMYTVPNINIHVHVSCIYVLCFS